MNIDRLHLLKTSVALSTGLLLPRALRAQILAPNPDAWRTFEVVTSLEIRKPVGKAQAWTPISAAHEADSIRPLGNTWKTRAKAAVRVIRDLGRDVARRMGRRRSGGRRSDQQGLDTHLRD